MPKHTDPASHAAFHDDEGLDWEGHAGPVVDTIDGTDIIECRICGYRHVTPLPSLEALEETYRQDYYTETKPDYLERARGDLDWAEIGYRDRLVKFSEILGEKRKRLLDVGSGPGLFLKIAKENGWRVLGVEPSAQAAAHTRDMGIDVIEDFFGPATTKKLPQVDVVNMNNMLEHVPNPAELLETAHSVIQKGGLVAVSVPNDYSAFQTAARLGRGLRPWWLLPHHHLNYFDFPALERLLARTGFEPLERMTSFPMEMFLLMGDSYIDDDTLGRACHARRKNFDIALETAGLGHVRRAFYKSLAETGLGREAVVIARKTEK